MNAAPIRNFPPVQLPRSVVAQGRGGEILFGLQKEKKEMRPRLQYTVFGLLISLRALPELSCDREDVIIREGKPPPPRADPFTRHIGVTR